MNEEEARILISNKLSKIRNLGYSNIKKSLGSCLFDGHLELSDKKRYSAKIIVSKDAYDKENIIVAGLVYGEGVRAINPVTEWFNISPSGKILGKSKPQVILH